MLNGDDGKGQRYAGTAKGWLYGSHVEGTSYRSGRWRQSALTARGNKYGQAELFAGDPAADAATHHTPSANHRRAAWSTKGGKGVVGGGTQTGDQHEARNVCSGVGRERARHISTQPRAEQATINFRHGLLSWGSWGCWGVAGGEVRRRRVGNSSCRAKGRLTRGSQPFPPAPGD
jgi:hypothetical protein